MHGNVWEWCYDPYGNYPAQAQTNPSRPARVAPRTNRLGIIRPENCRVARGGSYLSPADACRAANRNGWRGAAEPASIDQGFRVCFPWIEKAGRAGQVLQSRLRSKRTR
jgi:formylglycine-generating enzyme required for sulfatase activity